jgi:hypothetical protein
LERGEEKMRELTLLNDKSQPMKVTIWGA